jgi:hypothetical protein
MVGVAFNNRQLLGGFAGEIDRLPGALNPFNFPAQENVAQLLLDAHRMLDFESAEIQRVPAFVKLFRDACSGTRFLKRPPRPTLRAT